MHHFAHKSFRNGGRGNFSQDRPVQDKENNGQYQVYSGLPNKDCIYPHMEVEDQQEDEQKGKNCLERLKKVENQGLPLDLIDHKQDTKNLVCKEKTKGGDHEGPDLFSAGRSIPDHRYKQQYNTGGKEQKKNITVQNIQLPSSFIFVIIPVYAGIDPIVKGYGKVGIGNGNQAK
jgi:hypothetical protein